MVKYGNVVCPVNDRKLRFSEMLVSVTYDLVKPNNTPEDYERVIGFIRENYPDHIHPLQSMWILNTQELPARTAERIHNVLKGYDRLFFDRVTPAWQSASLSPTELAWLRARTPNLSATLPVPASTQTTTPGKTLASLPRKVSTHASLPRVVNPTPTPTPYPSLNPKSLLDLIGKPETYK